MQTRIPTLRLKSFRAALLAATVSSLFLGPCAGVSRAAQPPAATSAMGSMGGTGSTPAPAPNYAAPIQDIQKTLGFVPQFVESFPPAALPGVWEEMKELQMNPKTALTGKEKELIGLGVASQIPCRYCVEGHSEFAKANGAAEAEIGDAVSMAAITRHWSTIINGNQLDEAKFRSDIAQIIANAKKGTKPAGNAAPVTDGATALQDMARTMGLAPEFMRKFPDQGRAGAWRLFKDVQMNPNSALKGKDKELIGLGVAAQIPCHYCIIAHTEFAKLNGATQEEISEAIAMAALTREMSTFLNGMRVDEKQFSADVARMVKTSEASAQPQRR